MYVQCGELRFELDGVGRSSSKNLQRTRLTKLCSRVVETLTAQGYLCTILPETRT